MSRIMSRTFEMAYVKDLFKFYKTLVRPSSVGLNSTSGVVNILWRVARFASTNAPTNYHDDKWRQFLSNIPGGSIDLAKDSSTGTATILINHRNRRNALSGRMMAELCDIVTELERWTEGRAVLLYGAGKTFCSGGDLTLMQSIMTPEQGSHMCYFMQNTLTRLFCLPLVTCALVEGNALGGGAELAIACDYRVMATDASIGFVQAKLGIAPGWGGGVRLVQLIGSRNALQLLSTAATLSSQDADKIGLVDVLLRPDSDPVTESLKFLQSLTAGGRCAALKAAKMNIINGMGVDYQMVLRREREIFESVWCGPDHIRAMDAMSRFTEKKQPKP